MNEQIRTEPNIEEKIGLLRHNLTAYKSMVLNAYSELDALITVLGISPNAASEENMEDLELLLKAALLSASFIATDVQNAADSLKKPI
jgi:hypothetical protein